MNSALSHSQRRYGRAEGQNRRSTARIGSCGAEARGPASVPGVASMRRTSVRIGNADAPAGAWPAGAVPRSESVARTGVRVALTLALARLARVRRVGLLAVAG